MGELYHFYEGDKALAKSLGFRDFNAEHGDKTFVGEFVSHLGWSAKVFVYCYPAQFWRIEIARVDDESVVLRTGSGLLSTYWSTVELLGLGMISINGE